MISIRKQIEKEKSRDYRGDNASAKLQQVL